MTVDDMSDGEVVNRTVWGEARGEGVVGWIGVTWVIKNRADHPGWWGHDLRGVCLKPAQFSCWNENDPNRAKILELPSSDPVLVDISVVIADVLSGEIADPTNGATYYAEESLRPEWSIGMIRSAHIGRHVFYKSA